MLATRPVSIRLAIAYMATAAHAVSDSEGVQPFPDADPGNSITRMFASAFAYSSISFKCDSEFDNTFTAAKEQLKPQADYALMWEAITRFYEHNRFDDLCDDEIAQKLQAAMSVGFTTVADTEVPSEEIHKAIKLWHDRKWFRYEKRRDGRRKVAYKYAPYACLVVLTGGAALSSPPA